MIPKTGAMYMLNLRDDDVFKDEDILARLVTPFAGFWTQSLGFEALATDKTPIERATIPIYRNKGGLVHLNLSRAEFNRSATLVRIEDLPAYLHLPHRSPAFDRALRGETA